MFITFSLFGHCKNKSVMRVVSSTLQCERKKDTDAGWSGTKMCDSSCSWAAPKTAEAFPRGALELQPLQVCSPARPAGSVPFSEYRREMEIPQKSMHLCLTPFCPLSIPCSLWVCGPRTTSGWAVKLSPQQLLCATVLQGPLFGRVAEAPTFSWLASCYLTCFGSAWLWPAWGRSVHLCASCCLVPCWAQPPFWAAAPHPLVKKILMAAVPGPSVRLFSGPGALGFCCYSSFFPSYAFIAAVRLKAECCAFQKTHLFPQSSRMALSALASSPLSLLPPLTNNPVKDYLMGARLVRVPSDWCSLGLMFPVLHFVWRRTNGACGGGVW